MWENKAQRPRKWSACGHTASGWYCWELNSKLVLFPSYCAASELDLQLYALMIFLEHVLQHLARTYPLHSFLHLPLYPEPHPSGLCPHHSCATTFIKGASDICLDKLMIISWPFSFLTSQKFLTLVISLSFLKFCLQLSSGTSRFPDFPATSVSIETFFPCWPLRWWCLRAHSLSSPLLCIHSFTRQSHPFLTLNTKYILMILKIPSVIWTPDLYLSGLWSLPESLICPEENSVPIQSNMVFPSLLQLIE